MKNEIFRTRYNNSGDYAGFLFNEGVQFNNREQEDLARIAETYYNGTDIKLEVDKVLSLGRIKIIGRINPYIDRRKEIVGIAIKDDPEQQKKPLDPRQQAKALFLSNWKAWSELCPPNAKTNGTVFKEVFGELYLLLSDPSYEVKPAAVLAGLLDAAVASDRAMTNATDPNLLAYVKNTLFNY